MAFDTEGTLCVWMRCEAWHGVRMAKWRHLTTWDENVLAMTLAFQKYHADTQKLQKGKYKKEILRRKKIIDSLENMRNKREEKKSHFEIVSKKQCRAKALLLLKYLVRQVILSIPTPTSPHTHMYNSLNK